MEWLAQYAEFGLVNEQKLALVFVREVGAIDNATYRQLDSSITHARAQIGRASCRERVFVHV